MVSSSFTEMMHTKICYTCEGDKKLSEFYKDKTGKQGRDRNCISCKKKSTLIKKEEDRKLKERLAKIKSDRVDLQKQERREELTRLVQDRPKKAAELYNNWVKQNPYKARIKGWRLIRVRA